MHLEKWSKVNPSPCSSLAQLPSQPSTALQLADFSVSAFGGLLQPPKCWCSRLFNILAPSGDYWLFFSLQPPHTGNSLTKS